MENIFELKNVSREFFVKRGFLSKNKILRAVSGVSMAIKEGMTLGLVGESGCGKSTLARMAAGLLAPTAGEVLLEGKPVLSWKAEERASRLQMIFQDPFSSLDPRQKAGASVGEPFYLAGKAAGRHVSRSELREKVREMFQRVGLDASYAARYPHEFSGGQRQRIAIARALIANPKMLICDEPVSALDASVQAQVLNLLKDLQERMGVASLFISHDLAVVGFMSDLAAVMYLGKIVEQAECGEIFRHPAHPYTKALLDNAPAREMNRQRKTLCGEMPSPLDPPDGCVFHPRCSNASALCREEAPAWRELSGGHWLRCHFPL